ncbi:MAG TPA: LEA type 2 family protein [Longimicrobiales bacterium]|nr:LEA type 2 family protein [Longimicrobiales bacterium]
MAKPIPARRALAAAALVGLLGACATLGDLIQAPIFSEASGQEPRLRLLAPSRDLPSGGAAVRLWARVENPNSFGVNLAGLTGDLFLENVRAAGVDFPLGVPLSALGDTVVPLDISVGFGDLPDLADLAQRALFGGTLGYSLRGTVSVDAGPLGTPSFGPETLLRGELDVLR